MVPKPTALNRLAIQERSGLFDKDISSPRHEPIATHKTNTQMKSIIFFTTILPLELLSGALLS